MFQASMSRAGKERLHFRADETGIHLYVGEQGGGQVELHRVAWDR